MFITQKHWVRVLFGEWMIKLGNIEAYLNKHATCAHVRPWGAQKVGPKFYIKEHAKPLALFEKHKILTSTRLYFLSQYTIVSILNLKTWIKILAQGFCFKLCLVSACQVWGWSNESCGLNMRLKFEKWPFSRNRVWNSLTQWNYTLPPTFYLR